LTRRYWLRDDTTAYAAVQSDAQKEQYDRWWPLFLEQANARLAAPIQSMGEQLGQHRAAIRRHIFDSAPLLTHTTVHRWEMQHMVQRLGVDDLIEGDALSWEERVRHGGQ
jgi:hypothetical protein